LRPAIDVGSAVMLRMRDVGMVRGHGSTPGELAGIDAWASLADTEARAGRARRAVVRVTGVRTVRAALR
jgi:hypothetical protein